MTKCSWAYKAKNNMQVYHTTEWGKETHEERLLFELMSLELMQAGLSWQIVLDKRAAFQAAFCNFVPEKIVNLSSTEVSSLEKNSAIIRNRRKISAIINNARVTVRLHQKGQSLNDLLWSYVSYQPVVNHWRHPEQVPSQTALSQKISRDLKKVGFQFMGPTIVYSYLQAAGLVNDHLENCQDKY